MKAKLFAWLATFNIECVTLSCQTLILGLCKFFVRLLKNF